MSERLENVYEDHARAAAYARLDFPGTYFLAYRDLPEIIRAHVRGTRALDFGCGAGRSTRFLRGLGFAVTGVDVSEPMLALARARDPGGDYRPVAGDDLGVERHVHDLALAAFTFDNVSTMEAKVALFRALRQALAPGGHIVSVVSSPEIYVNEWASFSTREFPENRTARDGDRVRIVMLDVEDRRPVEDVLWSDAAYREVYRRAGLRAIATHRPLGRRDEPYAWVCETEIAPWVIYVLASDEAAGREPTARTEA